MKHKEIIIILCQVAKARLEDQEKWGGEAEQLGCWGNDLGKGSALVKRACEFGSCSRQVIPMLQEYLVM